MKPKEINAAGSSRQTRTESNRSQRGRDGGEPVSDRTAGRQTAAV